MSEEEPTEEDEKNIEALQSAYSNLETVARQNPQLKQHPGFAMALLQIDHVLGENSVKDL